MVTLAPKIRGSDVVTTRRWMASVKISASEVSEMVLGTGQMSNADIAESGIPRKSLIKQRLRKARTGDVRKKLKKFRREELKQASMAELRKKHGT